MKIEHVEVFGFRASLRGARNAYESWDKSDSTFLYPTKNPRAVYSYHYGDITVPEYPNIGPNDLTLACKLIKAGPEHRKFLRQIEIWFDITIPRYVWVELDTYKVSTVRNSCSTMHKLGTRDLTQDDFELPITNSLLDILNSYGRDFRAAKVAKNTVHMNQIRRAYKATLPEGFLQKATYTMNYETALSMFFQRRHHRLPEWKESSPYSITSFIKQLPYMSEFIEAREK